MFTCQTLSGRITPRISAARFIRSVIDTRCFFFGHFLMSRSLIFLGVRHTSQTVFEILHAVTGRACRAASTCISRDLRSADRSLCRRLEFSLIGFFLERFLFLTSIFFDLFFLRYAAHLTSSHSDSGVHLFFFSLFLLLMFLSSSLQRILGQKLSAFLFFLLLPFIIFSKRLSRKTSSDRTTGMRFSATGHSSGRRHIGTQIRTLHLRCISRRRSSLSLTHRRALRAGILPSIAGHNVIVRIVLCSSRPADLCGIVFFILITIHTAIDRSISGGHSGTGSSGSRQLRYSATMRRCFRLCNTAYRVKDQFMDHIIQFLFHALDHRFTQPHCHDKERDFHHNRYDNGNQSQKRYDHTLRPDHACHRR